MGDHQLHIYCIGKGTPTTVLEAPALGFSGSWDLVQTELAKDVRVCAYDRAGLGWSEASERPFNPRRIPEELEALLQGAGETAPYLLVGDGLGAAYVTEFAGLFPVEAAGLVLLDAPQRAEFASGALVRRPSPSPWLARIGVLRLAHVLSGNTATLPGPPTGALRAFSTRPDHLTRAAQEIRQLDASVARAAGATLPAELPVRRFESPDGAPLLAAPAQADQVTRLVQDAIRDLRRAQQ